MRVFFGGGRTVLSEEHVRLLYRVVKFFGSDTDVKWPCDSFG